MAPGPARPGGQPGDLGFLWSELDRGLDGAPADGLAGGRQLAAGPFGERLDADRPACSGPARGACAPFAVEEVHAVASSETVCKRMVETIGLLSVQEIQIAWLIRVGSPSPEPGRQLLKTADPHVSLGQTTQGSY
jgi:hypothetical protein